MAVQETRRLSRQTRKRKETMRYYFKFLITAMVLTVFMFEGITIGILKYPENVFDSSFQSLIQDKYRILMETNEPKIIVVSGSSSAFGLDQGMLEESCGGYKVVNLGLHAGFGHLFYSELAKANINKGDIVLLGYEYEWQNGFDSLNQNLIMSGIDNNIEMYTKIPVRKWPEFIGYLFKYAEIKNKYEGTSGIYSREAFDSETGQMIMIRKESLEYTAEEYGTVDLTGVEITDEAVEYLVGFKEYVEEKGASIYFIAPPLVADAIVCDYSEFERLKTLEEEQIGIPYISDPTDYFFPCELMFNQKYHCNSAGEKVRTELLIDDLKRAAVIE